MRIAKQILGGFTAFLVLLSGNALAQETSNPKLRLTIYANGLGLVDQARTINPSASGTITLDGVTEQLIVDSIHLDFDGKAHVQEIALDSDILSQQTLLERAVGKTVKVIRINPATGEEVVQDATVLGVAGGLVLKIGNRIETSVPGRLVFEDIPGDLHPRPVLSVTTTAPLNGETPARLAYLTTAFSWNAVYTAVLNEAHDRMNLEARARISSNAGIDLGRADVSLVAGDVARQTPSPQPKAMMMAARAMADEAAGAAVEAVRGDLSAFHIYRIPGAVALKDRGDIQRRLFGADGIQVARVLKYHGNAQVFGPMRGSQRPVPAALEIEIDNAKTKGLGTPLPAGVVRAYVRDGEGALRFIGEDRIGNTAEGAEARLNLGRAFNVTVERKQTDFRRLGDRTSEAAFTLTLKNAGQSDETVEVRENIPGDWDMLEQSQNHDRDGIQALWKVAVPAGGETTLSYRVRVRR